MQELLIMVVSLVVAQRLSSCDAQAYLLHSMWNLPWTRDWTNVPCTGRQITLHCTIRVLQEAIFGTLALMADMPREIHMTRHNRKQLEWSLLLFPQDCEMDVDSGKWLQRRTDSMLDLFFYFNLSSSLLLFTKRILSTHNGQEEPCPLLEC